MYIKHCFSYTFCRFLCSVRRVHCEHVRKRCLLVSKVISHICRWTMLTNSFVASSYLFPRNVFFLLYMVSTRILCVSFFLQRNENANFSFFYSYIKFSKNRKFNIKTHKFFPSKWEEPCQALEWLVFVLVTYNVCLIKKGAQKSKNI